MRPSGPLAGGRSGYRGAPGALSRRRSPGCPRLIIQPGERLSRDGHLSTIVIGIYACRGFSDSSPLSHACHVRPTLSKPVRARMGPRHSRGLFFREFVRGTGSSTQGVPVLVGQRLHHRFFGREPETDGHGWPKWNVRQAASSSGSVNSTSSQLLTVNVILNSPNWTSSPVADSSSVNSKFFR